MSDLVSPTVDEVYTVASTTVSIFQEIGLESALVGGAACSLLGSSRTPNDVDLVVFTSSYTEEQLKAQLVAKNSSFFLRDPGTPGATYKILYYDLSVGSATQSCKVDILVPETINIPWVPREHVKHIQGLPVMPFSVVLLLKLQSWLDHRHSTQPHKQYVDERDIKNLLQVAIARNSKPGMERFLPDWFIQLGLQRIQNFVAVHQDADEWRSIGFVI